VPIKPFSRPKNKKTSPRFVTLISGLPRSGTSLMMQMLEAGGMDILADNLRAADEDNLQGYYEFERVKKLRQGDTAWIKQGVGRVVKIISALLEYLPSDYQYKIIFMHRNLDEILASQKQMLIRRGEPIDKVSDAEMASVFKEHLDKVTAWLSRQANMQVLYVNYPTLFKDIESQVKILAEFLDIPLDKNAMLKVPDERLYRQRQP